MDAKEIDRKFVRCLNHMEEAIAILETIQIDRGYRGPKLDPGLQELCKAYNIIAAKRPLIEER